MIFVLIALLFSGFSNGGGIQKLLVSGKIYVFFGFETCYVAANERPFEKIGISTTVEKPPSARHLLDERETRELKSIEKGKQTILAQGNRFEFSSFEPLYFTASPNGHYALQKALASKERFYDSMKNDTIDLERARPLSFKNIINLATGDSIGFRTSSGKQVFLDKYSWSPDENWFAIVIEDTITGKMSHSVLIVDLQKKEKREHRLEKDIEDLVWNPSSTEVAVLTREAKYQRVVWNLFLIPLGRPRLEYNYDLTIIRIRTGEVAMMPVAHRTNEPPAGLFWVE
jgi:hypothetical protein